MWDEFIVYTASLADSSLCGRAAGSFLNTCLMEDILVAENMSELVVRKYMLGGKKINK